MAIWLIRLVHYENEREICDNRYLIIEVNTLFYILFLLFDNNKKE